MMARLLAPGLFAILLLTACGEETETTAGASSTMGGSTGGAQAKPIAWDPLPTEGAPEPRYLHTAVWTGSKMLIWGGWVKGPPSVTATGAAYDPEARTWTPIAAGGAPSARHSHTAVWTGSKMLVWGGYSEGGLATEGAIYDPATDAWTPMSSAGQPEPRTSHSVVWTGKTMLVWGGNANGKPLNSGGIYDPATDTWTAMSSMGAPSPRFAHEAVWTGSSMIAWAGYDLFDWKKDGGIFDGSKWIKPMTEAGAPTPREGASGVWGASRLIVWGGWTGGPYEGTGGIFDPAAGAEGAWTPMSVEGAPSPRAEHTGVWTGIDLLVWGGCGEDGCSKVHADGGRFSPGSGAWTPVEEQAGLSARRGHTAILAGSSVIVWGGRVGSSEYLDTGAASLF
jgi:N-acetylneuraminic acid mutarotase